MSLQSSVDVGMHVIAQNDQNTIVLIWVKNFQNFSPKIQKYFFAEQMEKGPKNSKKFQFFLFGIDSEWYKTYFKTKISSLKIFPRFFGPKIAIKGQLKNSRFFWSESIYNGPKPTLKWKYRVRKFFQLKFFSGPWPFFENRTKRTKKF